MQYGWLGAALVAVVLNWIGTLRGWQRVEMVTKPAALVLLIVWFSLAGSWRGPLVWYGLALVFSLAGDVLLMKKVDQFLFGLVAFLLAHLAYLAGFNLSLPPLSLPILGLVGLGVITVAVSYPVIRGGLLRQPGGRALQAPVLVYSLVLTLMMLSAVSTLFRPEWSGTAAILAAAGGILFFTSDMLLAVNRFVRPVRRGDFLVMVTYHLGQVGLVLGALLNFRGFD